MTNLIRIRNYKEFVQSIRLGYNKYVAFGTGNPVILTDIKLNRRGISCFDNTEKKRFTWSRNVWNEFFNDNLYLYREDD